MTSISQNVTPAQKGRPKGKRIAKPSTDKAVAIRLHALIVKHPGVCERAGEDPGECWGRLEAAHFIRRRFSATVTDLTNSAAVCVRHHRWMDDRPHILASWVDATRGEGTFDRLQHRADGGIRGTHGMTPPAFWRAERARLTAIAKELEILKP